MWEKFCLRHLYYVELPVPLFQDLWTVNNIHKAFSIVAECPCQITSTLCSSGGKDTLTLFKLWPGGDNPCDNNKEISTLEQCCWCSGKKTATSTRSLPQLTPGHLISGQLTGYSNCTGTTHTITVYTRATHTRRYHIIPKLYRESAQLTPRSIPLRYSSTSVYQLKCTMYQS